MRADSMMDVEDHRHLHTRTPKMSHNDRRELDRLFNKARDAKAKGLGLNHKEDQRLLDLYVAERHEIDALMAKWAEARAQLLDLDEQDKSRLLDLLLTARIRGCV